MIILHNEYLKFECYQSIKIFSEFSKIYVIALIIHLVIISNVVVFSYLICDNCPKTYFEETKMFVLNFWFFIVDVK